MLYLDEKAHYSFRDYFLVFLLFFLSGSRAIDAWFGKFVYLYAFLTILPFVRTYHIDGRLKKMWKWVALSAIVFVAHYISLPIVGVLADLNFIMRLIVAFLIVSIVGERFVCLYIRVIYIICVISLIFFGLDILGIRLGFDIDGIYQSILFYNHTYNRTIFRNCGPFWEPGAFQGYINLAILFMLSNLEYTLQNNRKYYFVFIVTILTTLSTTGYLVLGLMVVYVLFKMKASLFVRILSVAAVSVLFVYVSRAEFMGEKLSSQIEDAQEVSVLDESINHGRFSSIVMNWHYIQKHPLFGNGLLLETRYSDHYLFMNVEGFGNGFTDFISNMGILFAIIYFVTVYRIPPPIKYYPLLTLFVIILLLQGECYMGYPLFFSLIFLEKEMFFQESWEQEYVLE